MMYQEITKKGSTVIRRVSDGSSIPMETANTDYQAYLEWLAEGNEPEVIDL